MSAVELEHSKVKGSLLSDLSKIRVLFGEKDKFRFVAIFLIMCIGSILEAVGIGIIPAFVSFLMSPSSITKIEWLGEWTTQLPDEPTFNLMLVASLLLLGFMLLKALFLAFVYYAQNRIVQGFRRRLSCRMFSAYQRAPYDWLLQRSTPELQRNILTDISQVVVGIIMPVLDLIMATLMTIFIVAAMIMTTPTVTLLGVVITGGGVILVIRMFRKRLELTGEVLHRETETIIQSIQQGFGALVDARIAQCEAYLAGRFRRSITIQSKFNVIRNVIMRSTPLAVELTAVAGLLFIFLFIVGGADSTADTIPILSVLGVATIRLKQVFTRVAAQINLLHSSRAYIHNLISDIQTMNEFTKRNHENGASICVSELGRFERLKLNGVSYTYPNSDVAAIKKVSLELRRGESIGLVGPTGCGKSTLVNLILGLLEPTEGNITVNDVDIFSIIDNWRNHLGYIPQSVFLIDDTIRANIAFGVAAKEIDEAQLNSAVNSAQLDSFIEELPDGVDTVIGERGVRLSGGQRQRIGIARALYFNPEVLVMDEATSSLDNRTEADVVEAINNIKAGRTIIIIAHRLSTVEDCDRLYLFRSGELLEQGTFNELQTKSAEFRHITAASDRSH
jgi:ABC-type multidrug transport system fused ATPase/permease subunit